MGRTAALYSTGAKTQVTGGQQGLKDRETSVPILGEWEERASFEVLKVLSISQIFLISFKEVFFFCSLVSGPLGK